MLRPVYENRVLTTKDGLLWAEGEIIGLPQADTIARHFGFLYAEQLVKHLEKFPKGDRENG